MPGSNMNLYLQDPRNNFDSVRPAPTFSDVNPTVNQCHNVHISTNCYYGYTNVQNSEPLPRHSDTDCEMVELEARVDGTSSKCLPKKRCAEEGDYPRTKRHKEEKVQREKTIEPETTETLQLETNSEDFLETLYWNIHGGNVFHFSIVSVSDLCDF